jgi:hypothetical protein
MSELLSSVTGGGGGFVTTFVSGHQEIPASSSGDILVLTPPAGKKVKLTGLVGAESGITITVGSETVIDALNLTSAATLSIDEFLLSHTANNTALQTVGYVQSIDGGTDEVITITASSPTVGVVDYSYQFGV